MSKDFQRDLADLLRGLLEAVERGELEAETPQARALVRRIEGAVAVLDELGKRDGAGAEGAEGGSWRA